MTLTNVIAQFAASHPLLTAVCYAVTVVLTGAAIGTAVIALTCLREDDNLFIDENDN